MFWLIGCPSPDATPPDSPALVDTDDSAERDRPLTGAWEIEAQAVPLRGPDDAVQAGVSLVVEDLDGDGSVEVLVADDLHRVQSEGTLDGAIWMGALPTQETELESWPFVYGSRHESRAGGAMAGLGDGRVAIGGRFHNPDLTTIQGAVWILSGPGEGSLDDVALRFDGGAEDELGTAVATLDANQDGVRDLAAGAPAKDGTGVAWVVLGPFTAATVDDDTAIGLRGTGPDAAGGGLAAGDVDGDGVDDLVVGAPDAGDAYQGAVYVQHGPATAASLADADRAEPGQLEYDQIGSVLSVGDVDGDGVLDVLVGIPRYAAEDKGRVDLWIDGAPSIQGELPDARTGAAVQVLGDLDGDGHPDLAIGAPGHDGAGAGAGAVHLMYGPFSGTRAPDGAELLGEVAGGQLGASLVAPGDLDDDGVPELLIGAPGASDAWWWTLP